MTRTDLQQFDTETKALIVDPTMPINIVFSCIDKLEEHAVTAGTLYSEAQIVQVAYNLMNKATAFGEYLRTWNRTPEVNHTWSNFKSTMRQAQKELRETGELTVAGTCHSNFAGGRRHTLARGKVDEKVKNNICCKIFHESLPT